MQKQFFVYILSNFKRNVLCIGVTSNLRKRVWEHRQDLVQGFTKKYQVHDLLYYEVFTDSMLAIAREKQLKKWNRRKKNALIATTNPKLKDLYSIIS
ncbi:MAG: GIY-YIG nuclease family protein [Candidatus Shapirobacteria bacterium]